jgi:DNA-binding LytR/AlgR family response regulator
MPGATGRVLLHLRDRRRRAVDSDDIYYLEARGDETEVRLRGARTLRDTRSLGEVLDELGPLGFLKVQRNLGVNLRHVREIRPARRGTGWELRLEPPVNKVLPVSRREGSRLFEAFRPRRSPRRP